MAIGAAIGSGGPRRVEMTGMPELVAMLHSFVGLAAVLVGYQLASSTPATCRRALDDDPRRRGLHRRLHRRRDLHRLDRGLPQAQREDEVRAADPARVGTCSTSAILVASAALMVWFVTITDADGRPRRGIIPLLAHDRRWRCCSASTWSPPSAAATCRSSCRCSTATPAGRRRPPASCSATTC